MAIIALIIASIVFIVALLLVWEIKKMQREYKEKILDAEERIKTENKEKIFSLFNLTNAYNSSNLISVNFCLQQLMTFKDLIEDLQKLSLRALTPEKITRFRKLQGKSIIIFFSEDKDPEDLKTYMSFDLLYFGAVEVPNMNKNLLQKSTKELIEKYNCVYDALVFLENDNKHLVVVGNKKHEVSTDESFIILDAITEMFISSNITKNPNVN